MNKPQTDQVLLARFYQNGDYSALEAFVERHRDWALAKARKYYFEEADDIVQLSILRLMDSEPIRGTVSSPLGWWNTIIGAVAVDQLRKRTTRRRHEDLSADYPTGDLSSSDVEDATVRGQLVHFIRQEIDGLDHRFRETLLKRYFDDLSYSEISNILRVSPGTVASRLARAIARIRDSLVERGVLDLVTPTETLGGKTMPTVNADVLGRNRQFVDKWNDVWTIAGGRGLGRFKSAMNDDGTVDVSWRLDVPMSDKPYEPGRPETADDRLWFENELTMEDAASFKWSSYRSAEGATGDAYQAMIERDMLYEGMHTIEFIEANRLAVHSNESQIASIDIPNTASVVPDVLLPLIVCEFSTDRASEWPINLLAFERLANGRKWGIAPTRGIYSGRKGLPTGLSHTFEIEMRAFTGRDISIWVEDDGGLIGFGDERESHVVGGDETTTRSLLQQRSVQ